eukprot:SAG11_NODE_2628_length_3159_cov_6.484967_1_plen_67_part_00
MGAVAAGTEKTTHFDINERGLNRKMEGQRIDIKERGLNRKMEGQRIDIKERGLNRKMKRPTHFDIR